MLKQGTPERTAGHDRAAWVSGGGGAAELPHDAPATEADSLPRTGTATARREHGMKQETFLPQDYRPAEDEPFMNERQLEYFRRKLLDWKADILSGSRETLEGLAESSRNIPDIADRASEETDRALELRTRDRQRKLISKIDAALRRIETGDYGYCLVTGEPISLRRLDARPIATMTLEAQERHERREKVHRDN